MLDEAGFAILRADREVDQAAIELLKDFPLADRFRRFPAQELATITSYVLARKPLAPMTRTEFSIIPSLITSDQ